MRWIAVCLVLCAGCAHERGRLTVEYKPMSQEVTMKYEVEVE